MKTPIPLRFLFLAFLFVATPVLWAQEPDAEEVDRILGELEEESGAAEEPASPEEEPPVDEADSGDVVVEPVAEDDEEEDPSAIPAVSLEEAESVEGLSITGAENMNEGLVTISYTDVSLADMVRIFAQTAGANIIIPEGLDQPVSGNLNDVFWRDALEVILQQKEFALVERQSGIFTITPESELEAEPLASEILEFQYITAEDARPAVESLLANSNATTIALRGSNHLIVKDSSKQLAEIKRIVKTIDRPRRQVFIEAKFVELNDSAIEDLGINWEVLQGYTVRATGLAREYERTDTRSSMNSQGFTQFNAQSDQAKTDFSAPGTTRVESPNGRFQDFLPSDRSLEGSSTTGDALLRRGFGTGLTQGSNIGGIEVSPDDGLVTLDAIPTMEETVTRSAVLTADEFALTLSALQQLDGTRIVSNPKMLVANGKTASIHVGREEPNVRPTINDTEAGSRTTYELDANEPFFEIGVKLEVTPVISTDKNISIQIVPELSRLLGEKVVGDAETSFPIFQTRLIDTEFALSSGTTVAIGGLTQAEEREDVRKVPLLGDIPLIGKYLFTHTSTQEVQDEIIIFVTVNAVNNTVEMNDRDGIPEEGKLIHTWLEMKEQEAVGTP